MAGVGGVGGAGQDIIQSCSSISYSGDENDFYQTQFDCLPNQSLIEWGKLKQMLTSTGHYDISL